ncbi:MAG TPA: 4Fe-4S binding protein [Deltaproteobacteria bacterium]|nr:4Fe-4S binding protein [Deltaproteobacteria bacterium]HQI82869.1 4Fe-4S binding protein [Deltaproteobacteria bacterium]
MGQSRKIIEIDEERCNGCGQCILACAEGALKLVHGKAKLVGDILCDGLGACIGDCPTGALRIVEREAEAFDEEAVKRHLAPPKTSTAGSGPATLPCGCPSTLSMTFEQNPGHQAACPGIEEPSMLGHWPVKLQLLSPSSPFLKGSDMLLLADCCAVASPDLHRRFLNGKTVAIACPKLDDVNRHIARLGEILAQSTPRTLAVVHMEVPCCTGLVHAAVKAVQASKVDIPLRHVIISRRGEILAEEEIALANPPLVHV